MAFTVKLAARLSDGKSVEAAGFTLGCGPRAGSLRKGFRHPARATAISRHAWGLLLGAPVLTEAGLAPAGDEQREADSYVGFVTTHNCWILLRTDLGGEQCNLLHS